MQKKTSFLFGTVGAPLSTAKKPGDTVGGIARTAELGLSALELAWVQSVRVTESFDQARYSAAPFEK